MVYSYLNTFFYLENVVKEEQNSNFQSKDASLIQEEADFEPKNLSLHVNAQKVFLQWFYGIIIDKTALFLA